MARRNKRKTKAKRISFRPGFSKKARKRKAAKDRRSLKAISVTILTVLVIVCLFAAAGRGLVFLDKYVKKTVCVAERAGSLELVDFPEWVNEQLKEKIYAAAGIYGEGLRLDEDAARIVRNNLVREVAWLDEVTVQRTRDGVRVKALWRKPLAMVRIGLRKFYVDADFVVLDYVPMPKLPIVGVKGLSIVLKVPSAGEVWKRDDLAAAVDILDMLDRMDKLVTPDKPLLCEIDRIDVTNFEGRQNKRAPHIRLYTKDNIKIIWGAEYGKWQRYLEVTDEEKLAKLYSYYKEYGSLMGGAKYINLCEPQDTIPLPIDKY